MNQTYNVKPINVKNTGFVFKYIKSDTGFIHTLFEGELMYRLGLTPELTIGKTLHDFFPKDYADMKHSYYQKAWEGDFVQYESEINGIYKVVSLRPVYKNGCVTEVTGSVIDITEHVKLQEEVSLKKELHYSVLQTMSDGICLIDAGGKIEYLNENIEKLLGITSDYLDEDAFNQLEIQLLDEDGSPLSFKTFSEKIALKQVKQLYGCIFGIKDKYGSTKWLSVNSKPIKINSNGDQAALVSLSDITLQKEQEIELLELVTFKKHMLNSTANGIVALDPCNQIKFMNDQFHTLFQLDQDKKTYVGKNFADLDFPIQDDIDFQSSIVSIEKFRQEVQLLDGRSFRCDYYPILNDVHNKVGGMWIFEDITVQYSLRKKILQSKEEAEKANAAKTEFMSRMNHELRTPLNGVLGFAQLLEREDALNEKQQDFVQEIKKGGHHLLALINEMSNLSKIERGKLTIILGDVNLEVLLRECLRTLQPLAQKKQIKIEWDWEVEHSPLKNQGNKIVRADQVRLKQVILNLLDNAIKYNHVNGKVTITCKEKEQKVFVHIKDTGPGLSEDVCHLIFEPFYRVQPSKEEGTGIGLTIVNKLLQHMGGEIGVQSELGLGSDFWFSLPLSSITGRKEGIASYLELEKQEKEGDKIRKVLYVEDHHANLQLVNHLLRGQKNYRLFMAETGKEGYALALDTIPDLILLDLSLPDIHGSELMAEMKKNSRLKDLPFIAVSANAMPADIQKAKEQGFQDYLVKPLNLSALLTTMETYF